MIETELPRAAGSPRWPWVLALPALAAVAVLVVLWRTRAPARAPVETVGARQEEAKAAEGPRGFAHFEPVPAASEPAAQEPPEDEGEMARSGRSGEGIGAFPLPGTKRIKVGLVVPEDFQLPTGYMRHYQTTDKGEMLRAILMFHPDYRPVDTHGYPVPIPSDRIVPPEMAPLGLPMERLEVPEDAYTDAGAR